jgi:glutaredoxin
MPMTTTVTLLTRADCELCEHAKAVLARVAGDLEFVVDEVELATPEGTVLAIRAGMLFPPGVLLDGEPFTYGRLSERKLRRELARRADG